MPEIHWPIMIAQVITFLIAFAIVWKFAWKPIISVLDQRREKIRKDLEGAEQSRQSMNKLEDEYKQRLSKINEDAAQILNAARVEAGKLNEKMLADTQREISGMHQKAREQLAFERQRLVDEIRPEIVRLSIAVAEKALKQSVSPQANEMRFKEILHGMESHIHKDDGHKDDVDGDTVHKEARVEKKIFNPHATAAKEQSP